MNAIYIEPNTNKELELLEKIAELIGAKKHVLSENEKKYLAGLRMVAIAEKHPKYEITEDEIMNMVKEVENEVYGEKNKL